MTRSRRANSEPIEERSAAGAGAARARLTLNISMTTRMERETVVARFDISLTNMSQPI